MPEPTTILKATELVISGPAPDGVSTQPVTGDEHLRGPNDALEPPLALPLLARLSQTNSTRASAIDAIARNTVGLGYEIRTAEGHEHEAEPELTHIQVRNELERLASRDLRLDRPTFTELMFACKKDEEEVGNGYVEVSRNRTTGKIDGLFHCPGKRVLRLANREGFVMIDPHLLQDVRFYNFGEKVQYDEQGNPLPRLQGGAKQRWDTNELLPFKLYTSESRDYGMPRDVAMMSDYAGDKLAAEANVSFFETSGTPPTIIFVQGEESNEGSRRTFKVPAETTERIQHTLKSDSQKQHRVAIIPVPPGTKTDAIKLGTMSDRDVGNTNYRESALKRTLGSMRISPIFVAYLGSSGRYTAEIERALTLEQVFDPEQDRWEQRLYRTLMHDLGFQQFRIAFKRLAVEGDQTRRESADKLAEAGSILRRDYRASHGFPPMPEAAKSTTDFEWQGKTYKSAEPEPGQVPYGWNDAVVDLGQPAGAENRTYAAADNRGLQPGVGARTQRSTDQELKTQEMKKGDGDPTMEGHVVDLNVDLGTLSESQLSERLKRTRTLASAIATELKDEGLEDLTAAAATNGGS